jgi:hypothetical protein
MAKKLSELIREREVNRVMSAVARERQPDANSLFYFTDLSPWNQNEIDKFWPFEGSHLERAIALRLATRSAEEAVMAAMAWEAGKKRPCYRCGQRMHLCTCFGHSLTVPF